MTEKKDKRIFTFKNKKKAPTWLVWILVILVKLIRCTCRLEIVDPHDLLKKMDPWPVVIMVWHNRLLFMPTCFSREFNSKVASLASASRDGGYAAAYIKSFGLKMVRGSSSKGGLQAFRELKKILKDGTSVVLTVDGPRGPKYSVQPGAGGLAQMCKTPIIPITLNMPSRWEFGSWDNTQIPKPFSKITLVIGEPISNKDITLFEDREKACDLLREKLLEITDDRVK